MAVVGEMTPMQVRVLGCLMEKKATTPDQYPLTVNAARVACNQKTSRDPVVDYTEGEVGHTLRELQAEGLVREVWGARTSRYEHVVEKELDLKRKEAAALCVLMLRGPQTPSEIRARCQRLYEFADGDDVAFVLQRLSERDPALVAQLPRQPGQKECRWAQLLAGEPELPEAPAAPARRDSGLEARIEALEGEVARLREQLAGLVGDCQPNED